MAALAANRTFKRAGTVRRLTKVPVAANAVFWLGAIVAINASGYAVPASDTAALKVLGVCWATPANNTGGANGAVFIDVAEGDFEMSNAAGAVTQASLFKGVYVADDQSVTTAAAAANDILGGIAVDITATVVVVRFSADYGI